MINGTLPTIPLAPDSRANGTGRPLGILLSRQAADLLAAPIGKVLEAVPHRLIDADTPLESDAIGAVDIALLSRDITANSGKIELAPSLTRFYDNIRRAPHLRWLQMHAAGADRPIYAELRGRGITVTTASGANAEPVAQMAVTGLLALARRFPELMDSQRRKAWEPLLGARAPRDLKDQTAVVVGLGPIGLEIARLLKALRMRVIGVRRSAQPCKDVDQTVSFEAFQEVLPQADWVLLACPLTAQTRGLMNARTLGLLPRGAHVVNVSRGDVIVETDLIDAVKSGQVGGAYLDVLVTEPLPAASAIWDLPNVIVTPHTAGHTAGHYAAVGELFLDNLARFVSQDALRNAID